jgi:hypothetical protein
VHLFEFLDHKVNGQNWEHVVHYVNQKSADYVRRGKTHPKSLLAVELGGWSHDSEVSPTLPANTERIHITILEETKYSPRSAEIELYYTT